MDFLINKSFKIIMLFFFLNLFGSFDSVIAMGNQIKLEISNLVKEEISKNNINWDQLSEGSDCLLIPIDYQFDVVSKKDFGVKKKADWYKSNEFWFAYYVEASDDLKQKGRVIYSYLIVNNQTYGELIKDIDNIADYFKDRCRDKKRLVKSI